MNVGWCLQPVRSYVAACFRNIAIGWRRVTFLAPPSTVFDFFVQGTKSDVKGPHRALDRYDEHLLASYNFFTANTLRFRPNVCPQILRNEERPRVDLANRA